MSLPIGRASCSVLATLAVIAACAAIGCSKSAPPAPPLPAPAAAAPWSNASTNIEISRFGVNTPRPDGRACWTARYSVNLPERTLHVETCVDDDPIARDVTLADADLRKIQASLASLREGRGAAAECDAKASTFLVQIYDVPRKLAHYTDSANACHAGDMGTIDRKGLEGVFATIARIDTSARS